MSNKSPQWDAEQYEITLGSTRAHTTRNHQPTVNLIITLDGDGIEVLQDQPVVGALESMTRHVDRVLSMTEMECRRLGLLH